MKLLLFFFLIWTPSVNLLVSKETKNCDKKCSFEHKEITEDTLKQWPRDCETVCGSIVLNQKSNVSYSELEESFSKLKTLNGLVLVEKTHFKNVSFFPKMKVTESITISGNSQLKNIDGVVKMCKGADVKLLDNSKLDAKQFCESKCFYVETANVEGNKKDCGYSESKSDSDEEEVDPYFWYYYGGHSLSRVQAALNYKLYLLSFTLRKGNFFLSIISFFVTLYHCSLLLRKELRGITYFNIMLFTCICPIILFFTFTTDLLMESGWVYTMNECFEQPFFHLMSDFVGDYLRNATRKVFSFCGVCMVVLGTLSLVLSPEVDEEVRSITGWLCFVLLNIMICVFSYFPYHTYKVAQIDDGFACWRYMKTYVGFMLVPGWNTQGMHDTIDQLDGRSHIGFLVTHGVCILAMLAKRCLAKKPRRRFMRKRYPDNYTFGVVLSMSLIFVAGELIYGVFLMARSEMYPHFIMMPGLFFCVQNLVWTLVLLNPILQLLFCYLWSPLYRETVMYTFVKTEVPFQVYAVTVEKPIWRPYFEY